MKTVFCTVITLAVTTVPLAGLCQNSKTILQSNVQAESIKKINIGQQMDLIEMSGVTINIPDGSIIKSKKATTLEIHGKINVIKAEDAYLSSKNKIGSPSFFGQAKIKITPRTYSISSEDMVTTSNSGLLRKLNSLPALPPARTPSFRLTQLQSLTYSCSANDTIMINGVDTGAESMCGSTWDMKCEGGNLKITYHQYAHKCT